MNQTGVFHVQNTGPLPVAVTVSSSASAGANWLSATPASFTAAPSSISPVNVTASVGSLAPGTYSGTITISGANSLTVSVTLTVTAPVNTNSLTVNTKALAFAAVLGSGVETQTLNIATTGTGQVVYNAVATTGSGGSWLTVSPAAGTVAPSSEVSLNVTANAGSLTPGTYIGTIVINGAQNVLTILVAFTVSLPVPTFTVDTSSIVFGAIQGTGVQTRQLGVVATGAGFLPFTVSAATSSGGPWLRVAPAAGTATAATPSSLTVSADPTGLAPGTYSGSIVITSAGRSATVPVSLTISVLSTSIQLSQTGITFQAVLNNNPASQSFAILNAGSGTLNWTASASTLSGGSWLSVDQASGTAPSVVNLTINSVSLAPGTYYGLIQVRATSAANSPQSITVILQVLSPGTSLGAQVQPAGLIFSGAAGTSPGSQDVLVLNPNAQPINFSSTSTFLSAGGGFKYLPTNGQVMPNQPLTIQVFPDFSQLQAGSIQRGVITLLFSDGSVRTINVLEVVPPAGTTCTANSVQILSTSLTGTSIVTQFRPVLLQARVVDNCGNPVRSPGGFVSASFSNGDSLVRLTDAGNGNWQGTWSPVNGSQSTITVQLGALSVQGLQILQSSISVPVALIADTLTPVISAAASSSSFAETVFAPGELVSIFGQGLGDVTAAQATSVPLPTFLAGTQVLIAGKPLPLRYVSPGQINALIPFELAINAPQQLVIQRGTTLSLPTNLSIAAAQPGVYTVSGGGLGPGVIIDGNTNLLVSTSAPTRAGDTLVIYCSGLGAVNPPVPSGVPAPSSGPLSNTVYPVSVTMGGIAAQVQFAGLVPGYPDLYQVNAVVPAVSPGSQVPVILSVAGQTSVPVTIAVQ